LSVGKRLSSRQKITGENAVGAVCGNLENAIAQPPSRERPDPISSSCLAGEIGAAGARSYECRQRRHTGHRSSESTDRSSICTERRWLGPTGARPDLMVNLGGAGENQRPGSDPADYSAAALVRHTSVLIGRTSIDRA
jgi:hypothetical protein